MGCKLGRGKRRVTWPSSSGGSVDRRPDVCGETKAQAGCRSGHVGAEPDPEPARAVGTCGVGAGAGGSWCIRMDFRGCTGEALIPLLLVSVPGSGSWRDGRHSIRGRQLQTRAAGGQHGTGGEAPAPRARSARGRPLQRRGRGPWEAGGSVLAWMWGRARPGQEPVSVGGGRTTQPAQAPVPRPGGQNWAEGLLSPLGAGAGDWPLPGRAASGLRGGPLPGAGTWPGR